MKIKAEQLQGQLARGGLKPVYVVAGDEPLLVAEAADAIRVCARQQGYSERLVFTVEAGFDWSALRDAAQTLSLFAERRLIELRLPTGKPGDAGAKALAAYAQQATDDNLLLVITGRLDAAMKRAKWLNALEQAGALVPIWPVELNRLPAWVRGRMQEKGLRPTDEAVQLLVERVEGNLLAAAQEIDKLALSGPGPVSAEAVLEAVAVSARYDVFDLAEAALTGKPRRVARILDELRGSGGEPTLVLWALAREVRALAALAQARGRRQPPQAVYRKYQIWDRRVPLYQQAMARGDAGRWRELLGQAARADRTVKGFRPGNAWDELLKLGLAISGENLLATE